MRRVLVLAAFAAAALAGCGGGDGSSTTTTAKPSTAVSGRQLFTTVGCSNCHTLADAGAKGQVGPNLDTVEPATAAVVRQVTRGGGGMPAFAGQLTAPQIQAVARYVASVAGR
jgi:mono/diheme cytochrome c family protein